MSGQTNYSNRQPIGIHGGFYAAHESPDVVSYGAEILPVPPATEPDKAKRIPFGVAVTLGTNTDDQCNAGDGVGNSYLGIAMKSIDRERDDCVDEDGYRHTETVPVMKAGYAYITCPEGCVNGDPVDYDADGVLHNGGGGTVIPNATWYQSAVAGELGVIRVVPAPVTV